MFIDIPRLPSTMPTQDNLSSLPPATLRAALDASEKRIRREKEKIKKEIRQLQKRLEELEEGADGQEVEFEMNVAGGSQRKAKRPRADSPSDDDEAFDEKYSRWPIAKVRKVDSGPVSPLRYVFSGDETLVMTEYVAHHAQSAERGECVASGTGAPPVGDVLLASMESMGVI